MNLEGVSVMDKESFEKVSEYASAECDASLLGQYEAMVESRVPRNPRPPLGAVLFWIGITVIKGALYAVGLLVILLAAGLI